MEFYLKQVGGNDSEPLIIRLQKDSQVIGRQSIPYLLKYSQVSRQHAQLKKIKNDWFIEDMESLNGIYINGKRMNKELRKLENGDVIGFGVCTFQEEGFMCTFCMNLRVKREPIELVVLSDDESFEEKTSASKSDAGLSETSASTLRMKNSSEANKHIDVLQEHPLNSSLQPLPTPNIVKSLSNPFSIPSHNKLLSDVISTTANNFNLFASIDLQDDLPVSFLHLPSSVDNTLLQERASKVARSCNIPEAADSISTSSTNDLINNVSSKLPSLSNNKIQQEDGRCSKYKEPLFIKQQKCSTSQSDNLRQKDTFPLKNTARKSLSSIKYLDTETIASGLYTTQLSSEQQQNHSVSLKQNFRCKNSFPLKQTARKSSSGLFNVNNSDNFSQFKNKSSQNSKSIQKKKQSLAKEKSKYKTLQSNVHLKKCSIQLMRCDSKHFKWPLNVKRPAEFQNRADKSRKITHLESFGDEKNIQSIEMFSQTSNTKCFKTNQVEKSAKSNLSFNNDTNALSPENSTLKDIFPGVSFQFSNKFPNKFNTAVVKPMLSEVTVDKELHEVEADTDFFNYSQVEEVICISDDESYLDFNSSQPIKQEPFDESTIGVFDELPDENDIEFDWDANDCSESLENINKFIEAPSFADQENITNSLCIKTEPLEVNDNVIENTENVNADLQLASKQNNQKIQHFRNSSGHTEDSDDSDISSHSYVIFPTNSRKNLTGEAAYDKVTSCSPNINKNNTNSNLNVVKKTVSAGKTLLTEPKPMERRPRSIRGREEWFEPSLTVKEYENERNLKSKTLNKITNAKNISHKKSSASNNATKVSPKKSSNKNVRDMKLHRISPNISKSNLKSINKANILEKKERLKRIEIEKSKSLSRKDSVELAPKKPAPVKRRNDNFGSRSQFLINLQEEKTNKRLHQSKSPPNNKNKTLSNDSDKSKFPSNNRNKSIISLNSNKSNFSEVSLSHSNSRAHISCNISSLPIKDFYTMSSSGKDTRAVASCTNQKKNVSSSSYPEISQHNVIIQCQKTTVIPTQTSLSILDPRLNKNLRSSNLLKNTNDTDYQKDLTYHDSTSTQNNTIKPFSNMSSTSSNQPQISVSKDSISYILPTYKSTKISSKTSFDISSKISFDIMLTNILDFNVKWIDEQKRVKTPPEKVRKDAVNLPLHFNSVESYVCHFTPMLMLEMWEEICKTAQPILDQKNINKFYFIVHSFENNSGSMVYQCESVINKNSPPPLDGTLVIIDIKTKAPKSRLHPVFGYISSHRIVADFNIEIYSSSAWSHVKQFWTDGAKLWKFSIHIKSRPFSPVLGEIMKGNVICSIKNRLRLADALKKFELSPLCKSIIQPDKKVFSMNYQTASHCSEFTLSQKTVIESINKELQKPRNDPKIILLQGPPGTGKTHTIIGLLESLIFTNSNPRNKILMLAPSNAAIDEIGCRLIDLNERLSWKTNPIKFARLGLDNSVSVKMKKYTLDQLAERSYKESTGSKFKMEELKKKEEQIRKLTLELEEHPSYKKKKHKESLISQCNDIKRHMSSRNPNFGELKAIKMSILKGSQVILSTLGSCCQSILLSLFQSNAFIFSCCIIDEATQCTEPEILQPLGFGINKLILVGDHLQLPATVSSQFAMDRNFDRSMFERFHLYFTKYEAHSPIFMLTEQFRMHSEICNFPSRYFYNGKLRTMPDNDIRSESFPISPYIVYDILDGQEANRLSSKTNCNEARAIANICSELLLLASTISIGIITPYQAQVKLYREALHQNPMYKNIEVNTVDSFQGREKDIIIVSCVRANSPSGNIGFLSCKKRLNVAITRARKCLIICVHADTLQYCKYWKDLINDARQRNQFATVPSSKDMHQIFNETMMKKRK